MVAARKAGMPVVVLSPDRNDAIAMADLGATAFMYSSDQGMLKQAARQALTEFAPPIEGRS
jgi:2-keto-3-deoxy-L-rhamnonate aldolase RhmA